jgi:hypothetical protein
MRSFWEDNRDEPEVRAERAQRFDALPLISGRSLVRSLLSITVSPGRGLDCVTIKPLDRAATVPA